MARQLVFLDAWVKPLFKAAAILYPGVKQRLHHLRECREACKAITIKSNNARQKYRATPWPQTPWKPPPGASEDLSFDARDSGFRDSEQESRASKEDASFIREDELGREVVMVEEPQPQESRFTDGDSFFLPALGKRSTYVAQSPITA